MHLLIVNQYGLPAGVPGITRHGDLGAHLVRRGHDVTVIASRFNYLTRAADGASPTEDHDGVHFRWLDTGTYRTNDRQRIRSMVSFSWRALVAGLRLSRRPDVVLASSPHLLAGLTGLLLARRYRVPLLFEVRDLWPSALVDLGAVRRGSRAHRVLAWIERTCYRASDRVIIVPPHADRRVAEVGVDPAKCVHIPNATAFALDAVGSDTMPEVPLPAALEDLFHASAGRDILLYAGAQGVSNGLLLLFEAMDLLQTTDPDAYGRLAVVLIGDGGQHDELVRSAAAHGHEHVRFHPPIPKEAVPTALDRASFLLVSFADVPVYEYGLSPNKLFDYMAAARPVLLASRLADTPLDDASAGIRFEPGSAASLADGMARLVRTSPEDRRSMGERGRAHVRRYYTIEATGDRLASVLDDVTARTR
jgi:glycosyltransferase involved in cell wall biosynthesis